MKIMKNLATRTVSFILAVALIVTTAIVPIRTVAAETTTIITGGNGTIQTTLSTGESATVTVDDCCLQATVGTATYKFMSYLNIVGMATVADDDLLHIFTLSGKYYVVDLRHGSFVTIEVWRNRTSWKYVAKSSDSYEVFGSSIIDTKYFYERMTVNSVSRERLMTREEFELINKTEKPSGDITTETPSGDQTTEKPSGNSTTEIPSGGQQSGVSGTIDINWLLQQHINGNITWERLQQILADVGYTAKKDSTTIYFYDESGKLIKEQTTETTSGVGNIKGTVSETGTAKVTADLSEKGQATVNVNLTSSESSSSKASNKKKVKPFYYMKPTKNHRKLMVKRPGVKAAAICSPYFNKKKGIAKWDKITYKNIKYVGFTANSRQILLQTKLNKIWIIARAKSKNGIVYKKRVLKGTWRKIITDNHNLVTRVSNGKSKTMNVGDKQPIKNSK